MRRTSVGERRKFSPQVEISEFPKLFSKTMISKNKLTCLDSSEAYSESYTLMEITFSAVDELAAFLQRFTARTVYLCWNMPRTFGQVVWMVSRMVIVEYFLAFRFLDELGNRMMAEIGKGKGD